MSCICYCICSTDIYAIVAILHPWLIAEVLLLIELPQKLNKRDVRRAHRRATRRLASRRLPPATSFALFPSVLLDSRFFGSPAPSEGRATKPTDQVSGYAGRGARSRAKTEERRQIGRRNSGVQTLGRFGPCVGSRHAQQRHLCAHDLFRTLIRT